MNIFIYWLEVENWKDRIRDPLDLEWILLARFQTLKLPEKRHKIMVYNFYIIIIIHKHLFFNCKNEKKSCIHWKYEMEKS